MILTMSTTSPVLRSSTAAMQAMAPPSEWPVTRTRYDGYCFFALATAPATLALTSDQADHTPLKPWQPLHVVMVADLKVRSVRVFRMLSLPRNATVMILLVLSTAT
jgi:hypothetical protein